MHTGHNGRYRWIEWSEIRLAELLAHCPELVKGKYVAITACDSGPLIPSPEEERAGWKQVDEIAYSPAITAPDMIPRDGWDEWYIFRSPTNMSKIEVFVNYGGFSLVDPASPLEELEPTWCKKAAEAGVDFNRDRQERFWKQLHFISPESYIADWDTLIMVSDSNVIGRIITELD